MSKGREEDFELNDEFLLDLENLMNKYEDMESGEMIVQLLSMAYSVMHETAPSLEEGHQFMQKMLEKLYETECGIESEEDSDITIE